MQLIYRGEIVAVSSPTAPAYRKPRALNWRYQIPGETYGESQTAAFVYQTPRAINWRWQYASS
ncbi:MAG TPA: hypothetical protein V6C57_18335 [Coleofasciculaceae cyanobacterium]